MLSIDSSVDDDVSGSSLPPLMDPASSAGHSSSLLGGENDEIKGMASNGPLIPISRSSEANFPYCDIPSHPSVVTSKPNPSYPLNLDSNFSTVNSQIQNPICFSVHQGSTISSAYLNQLATIIGSDQPKFKVEPFFSQSIISGRSQETGLSTDLNPKISSSSKQEVTSSRPLDELIEGSLAISSINSSDILDFLWDY